MDTEEETSVVLHMMMTCYKEVEVVIEQTEKTATVEAEVIKTRPNIIYTPLETTCNDTCLKIDGNIIN